jgi:hypothetical protein
VETKIKKIDAAFLTASGSLLLLLLACWATVVFETNALHVLPRLVRELVAVSPMFFCPVWYLLNEQLVYRRKSRAFKHELDTSGFVRDQTFSEGGCTVAVDVVHRQVAVLFRLNPFHPYRFSAGKIERIQVDDGKWGTGLLEGSSRVSFLFIVDGVKIRVNTFLSNRRWSMDSEEIQTGISEADRMAEALREARWG